MPYEVHWGEATLLPGDYVLSFEHVTMHLPTTLVIREAKSGLIFAYELLDGREYSSKGKSTLVISTRGKQNAVESLRIAELGKSFVYERPPAPGRAPEDAQKTQTVPVVVAKR